MKRLLVALLAISISMVASAARLDWKIELSDVSGIGDCANSAVYAYVLTSAKTVDDVKTFISGWNESYKATSDVIGGISKDGSEFGRNATRVDAMRNISDDTAGYLVIIIPDNKGQLFYCYASDASQLMPDSDEQYISTKRYYFDEDGFYSQAEGKGAGGDGGDEWVRTTMAPSVPEPTVLALLALGVAGLALKRRV